MSRRTIGVFSLLPVLGLVSGVSFMASMPIVATTEVAWNVDITGNKGKITGNIYAAQSESDPINNNCATVVLDLAGLTSVGLTADILEECQKKWNAANGSTNILTEKLNLVIKNGKNDEWRAICEGAIDETKLGGKKIAQVMILGKVLCGPSLFKKDQEVEKITFDENVQIQALTFQRVKCKEYSIPPESELPYNLALGLLNKDATFYLSDEPMTDGNLVILKVDKGETKNTVTWKVSKQGVLQIRLLLDGNQDTVQVFSQGLYEEVLKNIEGAERKSLWMSAYLSHMPISLTIKQSVDKYLMYDFFKSKPNLEKIKDQIHSLTIDGIKSTAVFENINKLNSVQQIELNETGDSITIEESVFDKFPNLRKLGVHSKSTNKPLLSIGLKTDVKAPKLEEFWTNLRLCDVPKGKKILLKEGVFKTLAFKISSGKGHKQAAVDKGLPFAFEKYDKTDTSKDFHVENLILIDACGESFKKAFSSDAKSPGGLKNLKCNTLWAVGPDIAEEKAQKTKLDGLRYSFDHLRILQPQRLHVIDTATLDGLNNKNSKDQKGKKTAEKQQPDPFKDLYTNINDLKNWFTSSDKRPLHLHLANVNQMDKWKAIIGNEDTNVQKSVYVYVQNKGTEADPNINCEDYNPVVSLSIPSEIGVEKLGNLSKLEVRNGQLRLGAGESEKIWKTGDGKDSPKTVVVQVFDGGRVEQGMVGEKTAFVKILGGSEGVDAGSLSDWVSAEGHCLVVDSGSSLKLTEIQASMWNDKAAAK